MLETIKEIKDVAASCNKCSLCQNRKKAIFSSGNEISEVMFITDYPRDDEELALDFFEGKGGKLLQQALIGLGINKEKIYYTSLVKCNVGNKIIKDEEIKSCIDYLRNQVVIMRPKIVVLMGDVVVNEILGDKNTVAVVRGKVVDKKGIRYIGTYNPVMILNDDNKKVELWNDLKLLKDEAQKNNIEI